MNLDYHGYNLACLDQPCHKIKSGENLILFLLIKKAITLLRVIGFFRVFL